MKRYMRNIFGYLAMSALLIMGLSSCHEEYITYNDDEYIMFADTLAAYPVQ